MINHANLPNDQTYLKLGRMNYANIYPRPQTTLDANPGTAVFVQIATCKV